MSHEEKYRIIAYNLKKLRLQNNMTQKQLADKVGISLSYLSKIEAYNCHKSISLDVLFDIGEALEVNIIKFFEN